MATEQEVVTESTGGSGDWLSDAMGDEPKVADVQPESGHDADSGDDAITAEAEQKASADRDEKGRFKTKAQAEEAAHPATEPKAKEEPAAEAQNTTAETNTSGDQKGERDNWIPPWRAAELAEKRRADKERAERAEAEAQTYRAQLEAHQRETAELKRRLDELTKPKEEPHNLFERPEDFVASIQQQNQQIAQQIRQEMEVMLLENNLQLASYKYGDEFTEAYDAVMKAKAAGDHRTADAIRSTSNPGEALIQWYRQQKALSEFGTDPNAYKQKVRDELMKDPEFRAQLLETLKAEATGQQPTQAATNPNRPNTVVKRPPSLSGVPGGRSVHADGRANTGGDWLSEALGS